MKKNASITLLVIGLLVVALGLRLNIKPIVSLAFLGLGLFGIVSGVRMILSSRASVPMSSETNREILPSVESHTGFTAQLWGILFIVFGIVVIGIGLAVWLPDGSLEGMLDRLLDSTAGWGLLVTAVGVPVMIYGATRLLAQASAFANTSYRQPLKRIFNGIYYTLIGMVLVGIGLLLILSPERLKELAVQLLALFLNIFSG